MIPFGTQSMMATWTEPTATDNSGMTPTVTQSHQPGDSFNVGITAVTYTFTDMVGNQATCTFDVIIGNYLCFTDICDMIKGNELDVGNINF